MHSRFFLNLFAGILIVLCLLALLLFGSAAPPDVPSAAAIATPSSLPVLGLPVVH